MILHHQQTMTIPAPPERVFEFLDSPERLAGHMGKSSLMMGGGQMNVDLDQGRGQTVGSHIKLNGSAFGIPISLDEAITHREPPSSKEWQTVGEPRLLVIGSYTMGFRLTPLSTGSELTIFIDYEMPKKNAWLGTLFGDMYAKWCVRQMLEGARGQFTSAKGAM
jgi:carbon monoxide dehydrogenase subunit G